MQLRNRIPQLKRFSWLIAVVFVASLLVTLLFWRILPANFQVNENSDYDGFYEPTARNILEGRGFILKDGALAIRYPPGYPLLLAGTLELSDLLGIPEEIALSAFTLLGLGLSSVFLFSLARSVWRPLPALISSLVWMTYPFTLWLTKQPNSELPFMVIFYGGFYLFWYSLLHKSRAWPVYFLSGLLIGFAMLIRPIAIGVGFVMGAILWIADRDMMQVWIFSNTGAVVLLSVGGVPSVLDGLTFALNSPGYRQEIPIPRDVVSLMQDIFVRESELNSLGSIISAMTKQLETQPLTVAKLFIIKAARSWYATDSGRFETLILLIQTAYLVPVLWGSWTAWKQGGDAKRLTIGIWLMVLYFWGMTILVLSILRYMVPVMGLLFVVLPASFFNRASKKLF